ncbi:hypothetical protein MA16_Dca025480 [Dendrobium catenatum]|uniref:Uncharacterized protein n=1 Tax=Dendrobium catenatum TaxID=906689 RepID=A0A2I0WBY4_9ASPA|nr:hypothetical protein MA16_Dca025480 [Dendrobium catenatum]
MIQVDVNVDENILEPIKFNDPSVAEIACFVAKNFRKNLGATAKFEDCRHADCSINGGIIMTILRDDADSIPQICVEVKDVLMIQSSFEVGEIAKASLQICVEASFQMGEMMYDKHRPEAFYADVDSSVAVPGSDWETYGEYTSSTIFEENFETQENEVEPPSISHNLEDTLQKSVDGNLENEIFLVDYCQENSVEMVNVENVNTFNDVSKETEEDPALFVSIEYMFKEVEHNVEFEHCVDSNSKEIRVKENSIVANNIVTHEEREEGEFIPQSGCNDHNKANQNIYSMDNHDKEITKLAKEDEFKMELTGMMEADNRWQGQAVAMEVDGHRQAQSSVSRLPLFVANKFDILNMINGYMLEVEEIEGRIDIVEHGDNNVTVTNTGMGKEESCIECIGMNNYEDLWFGSPLSLLRGASAFGCSLLRSEMGSSTTIPDAWGAPPSRSTAPSKVVPVMPKQVVYPGSILSMENGPIKHMEDPKLGKDDIDGISLNSSIRICGEVNKDESIRDQRDGLEHMKMDVGDKMEELLDTLNMAVNQERALINNGEIDVLTVSGLLLAFLLWVGPGYSYYNGALAP